MNRLFVCDPGRRTSVKSVAGSRFPAIVAVSLLALFTAACDDDNNDNKKNPTPEPIEVTEIPLPAGLAVPAQTNAVGFTPDDGWIYTTATVSGVAGRHIVTIATDGSDFECLTCDDLAATDLDLRQPQMTSDGRRFAVRAGSGEQRHAIIECTPSVLDCATAELVPLEIPIGDVPILRNAQLRIAPGSEHALFTQIRLDGLLIPAFGELVRDADKYRVVDPRAIAAFRPTLSGPPAALELAMGNWGEAKGFTDGGASVLYYTTTDSLNFDSVRLDLATGELTRLTSHPEYDEDIDISPDVAWVVTSSYRNAVRMRVFSLLPRPPIVDAAIRSTIALLRNQDGKRFFDPWILPFDRARDDTEIARQVKSADEPDDPDVSSRGQGRWNEDGTLFVFIDEDAAALGTGRLKLATFPSLTPAPAAHVPSPEPSWAPLLTELASPDESVSGTLPGPESGQANIVFELKAVALGGTADIQVEYLDYSADGCSFLNGTETAGFDGLIFTWIADLVLTGCHDGFLKADIEGTRLPPATATGTIVTEYDGERVEGLPEGPYGG